MIEIRIVRESHMYKYEVIVSKEIREYGRFAMPRKCYDAAMKYCRVYGLDVDKLHIPTDLRRMWGF